MPLDEHAFRLRPEAVSHSMSGTLMLIFEEFVLFFIIYFFYLSPDHTYPFSNATFSLKNRLPSTRSR